MIVNDEGEVKIGNQDKVEETEKLQETNIYVTLYTDGIVAFGNRDLRVEGNQYYKAEDGILYTKDGSTLVSIPRERHLKIILILFQIW